MNIFLHTLGCKVNQTEAESILQQMLEQGCKQVHEASHADIILISTCAVTNEAERKSRQMARKFASLNPNAHLIVCGCASQKDKKQFSNISAKQTVIGTAGKSKLSTCNNIDELFMLPRTFEELKIAAHVRTRAFVRIQDGCSAFCSYCIIPFLRGRSRSRNLNNILSEINQLAPHVAEIVLTGINISDFKIDGVFGLPALMKQFEHLPCRIRLGSLENSVLSKEFVMQLSNMPNFCPHFHLCLQSGSSTELKRMNRNYTTADYMAQIELIRKYFPHAAITTDVIVGFPEQTEQEFEETKALIKACGFYEMHVFKYSKRTGTKAEAMLQVPANVVKQRIAQISELASIMKRQYQETCLGKTFEMLVEEFDGAAAKGKTENYLDAICFGKNFAQGQRIKVIAKQITPDGVLCEEVL